MKSKEHEHPVDALFFSFTLKVQALLPDKSELEQEVHLRQEDDEIIQMDRVDPPT